MVPGIGGSVLETAGGSQVWCHGLDALAGALVDPSRLSLAAHPSLRPADLLSPVRVLPWMVVNGYDGLVSQLINTCGPSDGDVDTARDKGFASPAPASCSSHDFLQMYLLWLVAEVRQRLADLTEDSSHQQMIIVAGCPATTSAARWPVWVD